jgi:hypothetical protein
MNHFLTVHRLPTMKTALWLMLTASILFAGNVAIGGVEWRRPAYGGSFVRYSFAIAFTTQMLFWLVLPTAVGMLSFLREQAIHRCWTVALGVFVLYFVVAYNRGGIFGFSDSGLRAEVVTLSALFGPLLAVEGPAMLFAVSAFDGPAVLVIICVIWLGSFIMATDKIIGSLQEKWEPADEAGGEM